jgi:cytochrome P450
MNIDLTDPAAYTAGQPYDQFRWLQDNDPVHWHELPGDEAGYFALTRYADLRALEADYATFSNEPNATLFDVNSMGDDRHKMMLYTDPPRHTEHRRFLGLELSPKSVKTFAEKVERVVDDVIDEIIENGECDLVADVGGKLASYVTADMMGLPREQLVEIYVLSEEINNSKSLSEGQGLEAMRAMGAHSQAIFDSRRTEPRDDMVTRMAHGEYAGCPVDANGAANRDPRAFPHPDTFDVARRPNAHVAFGFGPHFCLGSHLARQELIVMFRQLLTRMPDLEPAGPAVWELPPGVAPTVVGPRTMPVTFTPGPRLAA